MLCVRCEDPVPEAAGFCPACGHARRDRKAHKADEIRGRDHDREECPTCCRAVEPGWLYCCTCGHRIEHVLHTQSRGYSCGPAAMRNALAVLGLVEDEAHLREVMGAKAWLGTPDEGFFRAAEGLALGHRHVVEGDLELLRREVASGHPCVIDWRHGQHYVCVLAVTDVHVFFVDSNPRDTDMVRMLTHERFLQLWWDSDDPGDRHHALHVFWRKNEGQR